MSSAEPIVVLGSGRCGSTLVADLISQHHEISWLSSFAARKPDLPLWNQLAVRVGGMPVFGRRLRPWTGPEERYEFWEHHCPGFSNPVRDLEDRDLRPGPAQALRGYFDKAVAPKRPRLLVKVTGWPRVGFLNALCPNAKFVHVVRSCPDVVASWLATTWWDGWRGPNEWRWGPLDPLEEELWVKEDRSFAVLGAIGWHKLVSAARCSLREVAPNRWSELSYEELCVNPVAVVEDLCSFLEFPPGTVLPVASVRPNPSRAGELLGPSETESVLRVLGKLEESSSMPAGSLS